MEVVEGAQGDRACHAASLLAEVAPVTWSGALLALFMDTRPGRNARLSSWDRVWVRRCALRGLARLRPALPEPVLSGLLSESRAPQCGVCQCEACTGVEPHPISLLTVLELCRTESALASGMEHLSRLTPVQRGELLAAIGTTEHDLDPSIPERLLERWLTFDRHELTVDQNVTIARTAQDHPGARAVLSEHWSAEGASWEGFLDELELYPWLAPALEKFPQGRRAAARALVLPPDAVMRELGEVETRRIVKRRVLRESWSLRCPIDPSAREEGRARDYRCALRCLATPEGSLLAEHLLDTTVLHDDVRRDVGRAFFTGHRGRAKAWLLRHMGDGAGLLLDALRAISKAPLPADDRFLLEVTSRPCEALACYYAADALEQLGHDDDAWSRRLAEWAADPSGLLGIRAAAALARRGRAGYAEMLVRATKEAGDVIVRAEGIRRLGELTSFEEYEGVFTASLLHDHATFAEYFAPVAEEAAFALAKIGTDAALNALVQANLAAPTNTTLEAAEAYVSALVARKEGEDRPIALYENSWRRCELSQGWARRKDETPPT